MKLFTVGPVEMSPETRAVGSMHLPYLEPLNFPLKCETLRNKFYEQ